MPWQSPHKIGDIATAEHTPAAAALRADAARNRELIIAAAAEVFAERGLEASTADIAQRAGVGEATLFRRFASKQELIDAILAQKMRESVELMEECVAEADPERGLRRFFSEMIEHKMRDDHAFMEEAGGRCMENPEFIEIRRQALEAMGALLRRAQEAGVVREDLQPTDLSFLLMAAVSAVRHPVPGVREDIWKRYAGVILDGMRPEGATKLKPGAPPRRVMEQPG